MSRWPSLIDQGYKWRCMSFYGTSHVCNEDSGHAGAHGCQCGITWEDTALAVSATEPDGAQRRGRPS